MEFLIRGDISLVEIQKALKIHFPHSVIQVNQLKLGIHNDLIRKCDAMEISLLNVLWDHCLESLPELKDIPKMKKECIVSAQKIGSYEIGSLLGEGRFASVYKCCSYMSPKKSLAIKIMTKNRFVTFKEVRRLSQEIRTLKYLQSSHITCLVDVLHTKTKLCLVTENGGPDLFAFLTSYPNGLPERWTKNIIFHLMRAVAHCHGHSICHRDLKPENILMIFDPVAGVCDQLKLCDFGLAERFQPDIPLTEFCGSPRYVAPELILDQRYFGDKADIWSTGKVLLELLVGQEKGVELWSEASNLNVLRNRDSYRLAIHSAVERMASSLPETSDLTPLVRCMVQMSATKRPSLTTLCNSLSYEVQDITPKKRRHGAMMEEVPDEVAAEPTKFPRIDCKSYLKLLVVDACASSQQNLRTMLKGPYQLCCVATCVEEAIRLVKGGVSPRQVADVQWGNCEGSYDTLLIAHNSILGLDGPNLSQTIRTIGFTGVIIGLVDQTDAETQDRFLSSGGASQVIRTDVDKDVLNSLISKKILECDE